LTNQFVDLVAEPAVATLSGYTLYVVPQTVTSAVNRTYANTTIQKVLDDLSFAKYDQTYAVYTAANWTAISATFTPATPNGTKISTYTTAIVEGTVIVVIAQDKVGYQAYTVALNAKSDVTTPLLKADEDRTYITDISGFNINVQNQPFGKTSVTMALILAEIDFAANFQSIVTAGSGTFASPGTIMVSAQSNGTPLVQQLYTIVITKSVDTQILLKDTTLYASEVPEYSNSIIYNPQYLVGSTYTDMNLYGFATRYDDDFASTAGSYQTTDLVYLFGSTYYTIVGLTSSGTLDSFCANALHIIDATEKAAMLNLTSANIFVKVTAQDSTVTAYYTISLSSKATSTELSVAGTATPLFDVQGDIVYVAYGTTGAQLLANLDKLTNWQTITVTNNAGTANAGALADYNLLKVTPQTGAVKVYTIMTVNPNLTPSVISTATNSSTVTVNATTIVLVKYGTGSSAKYITAAELLAMLNTSGSRSYALFTSEGLAKTQTALFDGDFLVITTVGADGVSYTDSFIIVLN